MSELAKVSRSVLRCNRVGKCKGWDPLTISPCPIMLASGGFSALSPKGLMIAAREILEDRAALTPALAEASFRCTACGNCTRLCASVDGSGEPLTRPDEVIRALRADALERGIVPQPVKRYLENLFHHGNGLGADPADRDGLARAGAAAPFDPSCDYLFYVGDLGAYDPRVQRTALAVARLLSLAGVSFGVLGSRERSDGNEARFLGETALFEHLAEQNIAAFREAGVARVVALSPHAFNAFKRDYPALGGEFETVHYSELLQRLIEQGDLVPARPVAARVAYHDPCFLGRRNGVYDAPRQVLDAIPGLERVEMPRHREHALCCGGGAANAFTDVLGGGEDAPAVHRMREARSVEADIMAVACPQCTLMFGGARPALEDGTAPEIRDIAELLLESCDGAAASDG